MKTLLAVLLFTVCIVFPTFSQIEKGNFLVGGTMNYKYTTLNDVTNYQISIDPQISYFLIKHFSVGLIVPISFGGASTTKATYENHAIGPTLRYYFPINDKWAIFPTFSYSHNWYSDNGYIFANYRSTDPMDPLLNSSGHVKTTSKSLVAGIGGTYFITRNLGLEGILSYQKYETDGDGIAIGDDHREVINFKIGLQIYLIAKKNRL